MLGTTIVAGPDAAANWATAAAIVADCAQVLLVTRRPRNRLLGPAVGVFTSFAVPRPPARCVVIDSSPELWADQGNRSRAWELATTQRRADRLLVLVATDHDELPMAVRSNMDTLVASPGSRWEVFGVAVEVGPEQALAWDMWDRRATPAAIAIPYQG